MVSLGSVFLQGLVTSSVEFSQKRQQDKRVQEVYQEQAAKLVLVSNRREIAASKPARPLTPFERKLKSRISNIPMPSSEKIKKDVFDQEVDKNVTLDNVQKGIAKDICRGATVRLNDRQYTNTSHIQEATEILLANLSKSKHEISAERLKPLLIGFQGNKENLKKTLNDAFLDLPEDSMTRLNQIILQTASETASAALKKDLLVSLFSDSEIELNGDQKEDLKKVLFQCYQAGAQPLIELYTPALGGVSEGRLAGIRLHRNSKQFMINSFTNSISNPNSGQSGAATVTMELNAQGLMVSASFPLTSFAYDDEHQTSIPIVDYEGTVVSQFTREGARLIPQTANLVLVIKKVHWDQLKARNIKLQIPSLAASVKDDSPWF